MHALPPRPGLPPSHHCLPLATSAYNHRPSSPQQQTRARANSPLGNNPPLLPAFITAALAPRIPDRLAAMHRPPVMSRRGRDAMAPAHPRYAGPVMSGARYVGPFAFRGSPSRPEPALATASPAAFPPSRKQLVSPCLCTSLGPAGGRYACHTAYQDRSDAGCLYCSMDGSLYVRIAVTNGTTRSSASVKGIVSVQRAREEGDRRVKETRHCTPVLLYVWPSALV